MRRFAFALLICLATCFPTCCYGDLILNGGFEETPYNQSWGTSGTQSQVGGLFGSSQAVNLSGAGRIYQSFAGTRSFEYSFAFNPGAATGSRTLNTVLYGSPNTGSSDLGATFNLRSDLSGNLQVFSGSWNTVAGGTNAFTQGNAYIIKLVANDWGAGGTNTYDLLWSSANSTTLSNSALGLSAFQNAPSAADGISAVSFIRGAGNGGYTVDNVSFAAVPEPSSMALVGIACTGFLVRRRRRDG